MLRAAVKLWPTPGGKVHPNVIDPDDLVNRLGEPLKQGENPHDRRTGRPVQTCLPDAVKLWPTPTTQESEHPQAKPSPTGRRLTKDGKSSHSLNLADQVQTFGGAGQLNPQWVEWLMGFPDAWTDLED